MLAFPSSFYSLLGTPCEHVSNSRRRQHKRGVLRSADANINIAPPSLVQREQGANDGNSVFCLETFLCANMFEHCDDRSS